MAIRRRPYDIPLRSGGPRFRRGLLVAFGVAALVGLAAGIVWVIAGVLSYYVGR